MRRQPSKDAPWPRASAATPGKGTSRPSTRANALSGPASQRNCTESAKTVHQPHARSAHPPATRHSQPKQTRCPAPAPKGATHPSASLRRTTRPLTSTAPESAPTAPRGAATAPAGSPPTPTGASTAPAGTPTAPAGVATLAGASTALTGASTVPTANSRARRRRSRALGRSRGARKRDNSAPRRIITAEGHRHRTRAAAAESQPPRVQQPAREQQPSRRHTCAASKPRAAAPCGARRHLSVMGIDGHATWTAAPDASCSMLCSMPSKDAGARAPG